jgi:hypothetical protein
MSLKPWKYGLVGALALAVGLAGTAGAARLITGRSIKDGSIGLVDISKKARAKLRGARGPQGPAGVNGTDGINGAPGAPGTSGSTAPALLMGAGGADTNNNTFHTPTGGSFGSEPGAQVPVPAGTALVARDFTATLANAPGAGKSFVISLRLNGVDTALKCTIADSATSCTAPADTVVPLPQGSKMSMLTHPVGAPTGGNVGWSFRVVF